MKKKLARQVAIRRIISQGHIHSQEDLLDQLKQAGFDLTQATLSRDLKNLKVAKVPDPSGRYTYLIPESGQSGNKALQRINLLADGFKGMDFSANIAIIKTLPGYANSIASVIDNASPWGIMGTVAGDDTILIVLREGISRRELLDSLILIMPALKEKLK
jgi:transcriptional regulator of arginine metabolism